ncbi:MAG: hypothetical protein GY737_24180 [Desulfobacteraceae bacterium]|nr:hypothetical protein [Desulfobacteraceae bacterium]
MERTKASRTRTTQFYDFYDDKHKVIAETTHTENREINRDYQWQETRFIDNQDIGNGPNAYDDNTYGKEWGDKQALYNNMMDKLAGLDKELADQSGYTLSEHAEQVLDTCRHRLKIVDAPADVTDQAMETSGKTPVNAPETAACPIEDKPLTSLVEEIEKMTDLINGIGNELSKLTEKNTLHHDAKFADRMRVKFSLSHLHWANVRPSQDGPGENGGYGYQHMDELRATHYEKEQVDFFARGVVNTADGENIDFSFELNLDREYFREDTIVKKESGHYFIDPLVINLNGTLPRLSEAGFSLDLDLDGETEELRALMPGSGFLCLDKNHDGIINDGSELFGPSTGNGFQELIRYDEDQNLWIDENDEIFDELAFWENNGQGEARLTKIKDAGIGAIYLASSDTPFDLVDEENQLQARIKQSGIALNEDGSVSSVQEINWTV